MPSRLQMRKTRTVRKRPVSQGQPKASRIQKAGRIGSETLMAAATVGVMPVATCGFQQAPVVRRMAAPIGTYRRPAGAMSTSIQEGLNDE